MQTRLPRVLRLTILSHLDIREIANVASVCKEMKFSSSHPVLWAGLFKRDFSHLHFDNKDPKAFYKFTLAKDIEVCVGYRLLDIFIDYEMSRLNEDPMTMTRIIGQKLANKKEMLQTLDLSKAEFLEQIQEHSTHFSADEFKIMRDKATKQVLHPIPELVPQVESKDVVSITVDHIEKLIGHIDMLIQCDAYAMLSRIINSEAVNSWDLLNRACFYLKPNIVKLFIERNAQVNNSCWWSDDGVKIKSNPLGAVILSCLNRKKGINAANEIISYLIANGANADEFIFMGLDELDNERIIKQGGKTLREFCKISAKNIVHHNKKIQENLDLIINAPLIKAINEDGKTSRFQH